MDFGSRNNTIFICLCVCCWWHDFCLCSRKTVTSRDTASLPKVTNFGRTTDTTDGRRRCARRWAERRCFAARRPSRTDWHPLRGNGLCRWMAGNGQVGFAESLASLVREKNREIGELFGWRLGWCCEGGWFELSINANAMWVALSCGTCTYVAYAIVEIRIVRIYVFASTSQIHTTHFDVTPTIHQTGNLQ